jgi:hypothetical protein
MRLLFGGKGFAGWVPSPVQRAKDSRNQGTRLLIFSHSSEGLEWLKV